jgi:hypothetical protein
MSLRSFENHLKDNMALQPTRPQSRIPSYMFSVNSLQCLHPQLANLNVFVQSSSNVSFDTSSHPAISFSSINFTKFTMDAYS